MQTGTGWTELLLATGFFLLSHSIPVRPAAKARLSEWLSPVGFTWAYSALSIGALAWILGAAGRAPVVMLWSWATWQNQITYAAMFLCCCLAALSLGRPNPLSFGGAHNDSFDRAHPGIVGWCRHPLLVALLLWSAGHLLPNGDVAHVLLFGLFTGFSVLGMRLIDRRKKRQLGLSDWTRLASGTRRVEPTANGILRLVAGLAIFGTLLAAHGPVIGVAPTF